MTFPFFHFRHWNELKRIKNLNSCATRCLANIPTVRVEMTSEDLSNVTQMMISFGVLRRSSSWLLFVRRIRRLIVRHCWRASI